MRGNLQCEEGKLAGRDAVLVNESAGEIASEDGAKIVIWDLFSVSKRLNYSCNAMLNRTNPLKNGIKTDLLQQEVR